MATHQHPIISGKMVVDKAQSTHTHSAQSCVENLIGHLRECLHSTLLARNRTSRSLVMADPSREREARLGQQGFSVDSQSILISQRTKDTKRRCSDLKTGESTAN